MSNFNHSTVHDCPPGAPGPAFYKCHNWKKKKTSHLLSLWSQHGDATPCMVMERKCYAFSHKIEQKDHDTCRRELEWKRNVYAKKCEDNCRKDALSMHKLRQVHCA